MNDHIWSFFFLFIWSLFIYLFLTTYALDVLILSLHYALWFVLFSFPQKFPGCHSKKAPCKMYLYYIWLLPFCQRVKQKFVKYPQFLVAPWSFSSLSTFWCSLLTWGLVQLDGNAHQGQSWRIFCFHSKFVWIKFSSWCFPNWCFFIFLSHYVHTVLKY